MQKHQQWLDNRSYEQHLQVLRKIKSRKNHSANLRKTVRKHQNQRLTPLQGIEKQNRISNLYFNKQDQNNVYFQNRVIQTDRGKSYKNENQFQEKQTQNPSSGNNIFCITARSPFSISQNFLNKSRKRPTQKPQTKDSINISLKQQELLWNNFLLGKRILQTSPVISKKKHDLQYQKHKELLRSRTTKKMHQNSNFRLHKLQQHNNQIYKISDDHRIQQNLHKRYMVTLVIQSIQIFKFKFSSFENIILTMKHGQKQNRAQKCQYRHKITKQVSECIPSSLLTSYNFFFTYKKRNYEQNLPIIIQIKNVKSLNVISIGTFSFQFNNFREIIVKEANLYNFGKLIGNVKFNAYYGKKNQFLSHLQ